MHKGKLVFAQLMDHLQPAVFRECVKKYRGSSKPLSFSYLDQFLVMAFAQEELLV